MNISNKWNWPKRLEADLTNNQGDELMHEESGINADMQVFWQRRAFFEVVPVHFYQRYRSSGAICEKGIPHNLNETGKAKHAKTQRKLHSGLWPDNGRKYATRHHRK